MINFAKQFIIFPPRFSPSVFKVHFIGVNKLIFEHFVYAESPTEYCESPIETPRSPIETPRKEDASATVEKNGVNFVVSPKESKTKKGNPTRAISTVTSMLWEDVLKNPKKELSPGSDFINRKKNQCAEKMIRGAFVELYRGLGLLKTYRFNFQLI